MRSPALPHVADRPTGQSLAELAHTVRQLAQNPLNGAVRIDGIHLEPMVAVRVQHKLGRMPEGWFPCRVRVGPFQAFETACDAKSLTLYSATASVVDLLVF